MPVLSVHRNGVVALAVLAAALGLPGVVSARAPEAPQVLFQELFRAVQTAQLYADSKAFADAVPQAAPAEILRQYRLQRPDSPQALRHFVDTFFTMPTEAPASEAVAPHLPLAAHIDALWDRLTHRTSSAPRGASLLPVPKPYVVPGGRFRELYYWDSYFTMLGLLESGRHDLVEDMVADFAYLIDTYGHVPNGTRSYYLSRSQPPFFYAMVELSVPEDPAAAYAHFLPELRREYDFWMQGAAGLQRGAARRRVVALEDGIVLNRYWDDSDKPRDESYREDVALAQRVSRPEAEVYRDIRAAAESGWDFSSRWLADGLDLATIDTTSIVPVDLNALLYGLENAIRAGCQRRGQRACAQDFARRAGARRAAMDTYLWDGAAGVYRDYDWRRRERTPRPSAATLYPLFTGQASDAQARAVAGAVVRELLAPGGIATTSVRTGQQWDAPNGWAPLQWIGVDGLRRYGESSLAESVACRWMMSVKRVYRDEDRLVEKYDVLDPGRSGGGGEYPLQDGFGWTNGVMRKLMALYPEDYALPSGARCPQPAGERRLPQAG
jgi:alpha,alpha-trehalase